MLAKPQIIRDLGEEVGQIWSPPDHLEKVQCGTTVYVPRARGLKIRPLVFEPPNTLSNLQVVLKIRSEALPVVPDTDGRNETAAEAAGQLHVCRGSPLSGVGGPSRGRREGLGLQRGGLAHPIIELKVAVHQAELELGLVHRRLSSE